MDYIKIISERAMKDIHQNNFDGLLALRKNLCKFKSCDKKRYDDESGDIIDVLTVPVDVLACQESL